MSKVETSALLLQSTSWTPPFTNGKFNLRCLEELPEPDAWLIECLFPALGIVTLYGPSGSAKSFAAVDIAACLASGLPWFGYPTKKSRVVYVLTEGKGAFRRRVLAWEKRNEMKFPVDVKFVLEPFAINKVDQVDSLGKLIAACGGADMIIIDTLNRAAPGADENSSSDMGKIIAGASALQEATGSLVLFVHHTGKDASRGPRGHSSYIAAVDSAIEFFRDGNRRWWKLVKSKDGEDGISRAFELSVVELGASESGRPINSCAIVEVEGGAPEEVPRKPRGQNQKVILAAFPAVFVEYRLQCSAAGQDCPESMPFSDAVCLLKDKLEGVDQNHRQIRTKETLEALIKQGYLIRVGDSISLANPEFQEGGQ